MSCLHQHCCSTAFQSTNYKHKEDVLLFQALVVIVDFCSGDGFLTYNPDGFKFAQCGSRDPGTLVAVFVLFWFSLGLLSARITVIDLQI